MKQTPSTEQTTLAQREMLVKLRPLLDQNIITRLGSELKTVELLNSTYPFGHSKIDWKKVPESVSGVATGEDRLEVWLDFMCKQIENNGLSGTATYVADGTHDVPLTFDLSDIRKVAPVLFEFPNHHYIVGPEGAWVFAFTTLGEMGFGCAPNPVQADLENIVSESARSAVQGHQPGAADERRSINIRGINYTNFSAEPIERLLGWLPRGLKAEEVIFMPDVCPGKSPLPTGTAVKTSDPSWRRLAVSDCGCGMQLLRSQITFEEFQSNLDNWDRLGQILKRNNGKLGDLGHGNHFLDALVSKTDGMISFLIHTGSRNESGLVDHLVDDPQSFDREFERVVLWARQNRDEIAKAVRTVYGDCAAQLDMPHNTIEKLEDGAIIIRKGAIKATPGQLVVLPSHLTGDVSLVVATPKVAGSLFSLSHGTGRSMSRGDAKGIDVDFDALRKRVHIPDYVANSSLKTEGPHCYRDLDDCLGLLGGLVSERERFSVIAYLGHL